MAVGDEDIQDPHRSHRLLQEGTRGPRYPWRRGYCQALQDDSRRRHDTRAQAPGDLLLQGSRAYRKPAWSQTRAWVPWEHHPQGAVWPARCNPHLGIHRPPERARTSDQTRGPRAGPLHRRHLHRPIFPVMADWGWLGLRFRRGWFQWLTIRQIIKTDKDRWKWSMTTTTW